MKYKNKLSVCMMVKNEEKYLGEVLESLQPIFESLKTELIIVDTGSEDNTIEIAKRYTEQVYFHQWSNDFASMRNKTIEYSTGEWILVLDGDEVFKNIDPLIEFLKSSKSKNYNSGSIGIRNISSKEEDDKSQSRGNVLRLFRNTDNFKYEGLIHEQPLFKEPIYFSNAEIIHYGYDYMDKELMEYKFRRNIELLSKELEKNPDNIYVLFQLSQSYSMYNRNKTALDMIIRAYELVKKQKSNGINHLNVYNQLIRLYFESGKYNELEKICKEALELIEFVDFYYYLAISQIELNKNKESLKNFNRYLELLEENDISSKDLFLVKDTLDFYENAYINMATIYKELKEHNKSLEYLEKVMKTDLREQKISILVESYIELKRYRELKMKYIKLLNEEGNENLISTFWIAIENGMEKQNEEENENIIRLFSRGDCTYSLLNNARLSANKQRKNRDLELIEEIKTLNFESLPSFFADAIYLLLIQNNIKIGDILYNLNQGSIQSYIQYLLNKYDDEIGEILLDYLRIMDNDRSFNEIRFQKELTRILLANNLVLYSKHKEIFNQYLNDGIEYIQEIYNKDILDNEYIYYLKDSEEVFFAYMYVAEKIKKEDTMAYIKYLRKALKIYPAMKEGIELRLYDLKKDIEDEDIDASMDSREIKKVIKSLISENKLREARKALNQYEKVIEDDIDIYSIKGVIAMMEGKMRRAENIFKAGLNIDDTSFSLLYNIAYLYQYNGDFELAIKYYNEAIINAEDEEARREVSTILEEIKDDRTKNYIKQDKEIK